ncbi:MAG: Ig domain-containing protein [Proteobacteria bacterium]|nr:Ig domain-containing protein [Pseudomonadota bacterium]
MKKSDSKGFALFFLIAAILVVSALIGAGITMIGPRVIKAKYDRTGEILTAAMQSVISWSVQNGQLPDAATFPSIIPSAVDDWGRPLVYIYDDNLTNSTTGGICGRQNTALSYGANNTAFIIVSGAEDLTVNTAPSASGAFAGTVASGTADIVRFISLEDLKNQAGCFGFTTGVLKILNNELPDAVSGTPYNNVRLYADGGVPPYVWSATGLPTGLNLIDSNSGTLSGTPTTPDSPSVTITATDATGSSVSRSYTLNVF